MLNEKAKNQQRVKSNLLCKRISFFSKNIGKTDIRYGIPKPSPLPKNCTSFNFLIFFGLIVDAKIEYP